jgi:hypothetical protein
LNDWKRYSSPEILKSEVSEADSKTVVFSLGMIFYSILNENIPFIGFDGNTAGNMIVSGSRPSTKNIDEFFKKWVELIILCWNSERKNRPELKKMLEGFVVEGGKKIEDEVNRMNKKENEKEREKNNNIK